jgi:phenylpropionate dioxygenase-like ring-hydroxylating dioxygenase large terminal subunit
MAKLSLQNYWHPIATTEEVSDRPRAFTLLGERLVAFRTAEGVAVFKDLCIHRGAALSGGTVCDGTIVCPYHGWRYDRSGACVHIPSLPPNAPIPEKAHAIAYEEREAFGLVWVCLAKPAMPFPEWPDDVWNRDDYKVVFVKAYDWNASAGRVVENAMDFSHFNFVHAGYTELADGPLIKPHEVVGTERGFSYSYDDTHLMRSYVVEFPFIVHDRKSVVALSNTKTWSDGANSKPGDITLLSFIASPVSETHTRIYVFVGRNHSLDKDDAEFTSGFDTVMEQDRVIVEKQRPEQIPIEIKEELHLRFPDAASLVYRRMLRELEKTEAFVP